MLSGSRRQSMNSTSAAAQSASVLQIAQCGYLY